MADILARLEAQLEDLDACTSSDDDDEEDSSDSEEESDDSDSDVEEEEDEKRETEEKSEEKETDCADGDQKTQTGPYNIAGYLEENSSYSSSNAGNASTGSAALRSMVTTTSTAERRLSQTRMDISAQLEAEKARLDSSSRDGKGSGNPLLPANLTTKSRRDSSNIPARQVQDVISPRMRRSNSQDQELGGTETDETQAELEASQREDRVRAVEESFANVKRKERRSSELLRKQKSIEKEPADSKPLPQRRLSRAERIECEKQHNAVVEQREREEEKSPFDEHPCDYISVLSSQASAGLGSHSSSDLASRESESNSETDRQPHSNYALDTQNKGQPRESADSGMDGSAESLQSLRALQSLPPTIDANNNNSSGKIHFGSNRSISNISTAKLRYLQERDQLKQYHNQDNEPYDPNKNPYHHGRTPFGKKIQENQKQYNAIEPFCHTREARLALVVLLLLASIMGVQLTKFAAHQLRLRDPNWKFQQAAQTALQSTKAHIEQITLDMQHLARRLKHETQQNNQTWPWLSNHHFLQRHAYRILKRDHHLKSIILAPLVKPTQWKQYQYFIEDTQHQTPTFLQWDPNLINRRPVNAKSIFVPWQQLTRKKTHHPNVIGPILKEWYHDLDEQGPDPVWEAMEQSNTTAIPRLLLVNRESLHDYILHHDYILQPIIDSVVVKKGFFFFRPDRMEDRVVFVMAAQLQWDVILQNALETALVDYRLNINEIVEASAVATLQDRCTEATTRSNIPIRRSNENNSPVKDHGTAWDFSRGKEATSISSVSEELELAAPTKAEAHASPPNNPPFSFGTRTAKCPTASKWRLQLHSTVELADLLTEGTREVYEILATWIVGFVLVSCVVLFKLYEIKQEEELKEIEWREVLAKESLDIDMDIHTATVIVIGIVGLDQWANNGPNNNNNQERQPSPSTVVSLVTSLLQNIDRIAAKYSVVKIQSVGGEMMYATGGPDHVNHVLRFAKECYGRLQDWKREWASTYEASVIENLQLRSGLGHGSLLGMDGSASHLSGDAIQEASRLEAQAQPGKVCLSREMEEVLNQLGKGAWIQTSDDDPSSMWLDFPATNRRRHSFNGTMDKIQGNRSIRSRRSLNRIADNTGTQQNQSLGMEPAENSGVPKNSRRASLHEHMDGLQKEQESPPPLDKLPADEPPVAVVDVSSSNNHGYEPMEHSDDERSEDEVSEEYEDDDESSHASLEQKQMVIEIAQQKERLLDWTVDVLTRCLEEILAARTTHNSKKALSGVEASLGMRPLAQCKEFISIPIFSKAELRDRAVPGSVPLTDAAHKQIRDYVTKIAMSYKDHCFHNFEHAANVTASMRKLYNKLIGGEFGRRRSANLSIMKETSGRNVFSGGNFLGQETSYGIKTDPLLKFTIMFCALIHDADHPGVPNDQLIREKSPMAAVYVKSIAEQNSVEFAWSLLMRPEYVDLRSAIYSNEKELRRFRQVIVNCVLSTDLHDVELQTLRKARWAKAFAEDDTAVASGPQSRGKQRSANRNEESIAEDPQPQPNSMLDALRQVATGAGSLISKTSLPKNDINRKGTIVLEHLLQAADIGHTMQNWKVYLKWNERLFDEYYEAYEAGRNPVNPASLWYRGELDFFDSTVIPLASKLSKCHIFDDGGEDLLENAIANRAEWASCGEEVIAVYVSHYQESHVHQVPPQAEESKNPESAFDSDAGADVGSSAGLTSKNSSAGSLSKFLETGEPQKRESDGNRSAHHLVQDENNRSIFELGSGGDDAPGLEPGTATSSVAGTFSNSAEDLAVDDPDIVFAVLEDLDAPDDFYSYVLLTPAQMRQRAKEEKEHDSRSVNTTNTGEREDRRRFRRTQSSASHVRSGMRKRGSTNSRKSLVSTASNGTEGSGVRSHDRSKTVDV